MSTSTTSSASLQHAVGHGLAHGDAGDARDDVGEAFEMLDVERRPDVDAGVEQFLDVLPALGMAAVGRVGVGEFVDDDELGLARQRRVDVELLDLLRRDSRCLGAAGSRGLRAAPAVSRAAVGFDQADDHVAALALAARGRAAASHRSCRRRARRRERPSACRAPPFPPAPAARRDRAGGRCRSCATCLSVESMRGDIAPLPRRRVVFRTASGRPAPY